MFMVVLGQQVSQQDVQAPRQDGNGVGTGDRVPPLKQQVLQDVPVPSQALSQNVNAVALRPYLPPLCPA